MNIIEYNNVSKKYKETVVVDNFSIAIPEGSFTVFMGRSGSGKTTLLKMLNLLVEPTKGEIYFKGKNNRDIEINELRQQMGYVLQSGALFPHRTIVQNIETIPRLLGWNNEEIHHRTRELMKIMGLDYDIYGKRYPAQLSGGQQQRVGIARAMAANPPVLLMDEPFSALDAIIRDKLQKDLLDIQKKSKITIIFVTHNIDEAFRLGDQIVFIEKGSLIQKGSPLEFLRYPADKYIEKMLSFLSLETIEKIEKDKVVEAI